MAVPSRRAQDTGDAGIDGTVASDDLLEALTRDFAIERELGGGGMSRVVVATERALGRRVVVKVLHPDLAAAVSRERFLREIHVAASLAHPHIVPLLTSGEAAGLPYYTMPFLEGETLSALLRRDGPLAPPEAVRLLEEVASALAFAHRQGIVHRDVKPANILIQDGHALVADFGIARALSRSATSGTLTQHGVTLGTPAYMSPEQAVGEADIDGRADTYSLGCVLFEMLTGRAPFEGTSAAAVIGKHLSAPIPKLGGLRPGLASSLDGVLATALAKDRALRPAQVTTFALAARQALGPPGTPPQEVASIAVLPFANLSPDPADAYFADGLTDELITDLSGVRSLHVIARGSMMRFRDSGRDPADVARELDVGYALDGTVRRAGTTLRLTVRLVDARDGRVVWSDKLGGALTDVFEMQERVSRAIVDALRVRLSPGESSRLSERPVADVSAYEAFLQARQAMWHFAPASLERARRLLEEALDRHGESPALLGALGHTHLMFAEVGDPAPAAHLEAARGYATRVRALAPRSFEAEWLEGMLAFRRGAIREAIEALARARESRPSSPDVAVMQCYAHILAGRDEAARRLADEAIALDPLTPLLQCMPGFCEWVRGRYDEAEPYYRRYAERDPQNPSARWFLLQLLANAGKRDEASRVAQALETDAAGTAFGRIGRVFRLALEGRADEARAALDDGLRAAARHSEVFARNLAELAATCGDVDGALELLEHAVRLGNAHHPFLAEHDRLLAPLRGHPRFEALLQVVRQRWERGGASDADHLHPEESPVGAKPSVAVLPLANLSSDPDNEYFAEGIAEDLIAQLAGIRSLRVISKTSTARFRHGDRPAREIAEALGVRTLVTGSVRRAGSRVRVVAQLIDPATETHLWTGTYDRSLDDVFAVQADIATQIAGALAASLSPDERRRLASRPTADPAAYELMLIGRHHLNRRNDESLRRAIACFEQATARDPAYAAAWAGLAETFVFAAIGYASLPTEESFGRAEECARRAIALDPALAEGHCALGMTALHHGWDVARARAAFERALDANPNAVTALQYLAWCEFSAGDYAGAVRVQRRALILDPLNATLVTESGWPFSYAGLHERALPRYLRAIEIDPAFGLGHYNAGMSYFGLGRYDEALASYEEAVRLMGRPPWVIAWIGMAHVARGEHARAESLLEEIKAIAAGGVAASLWIGLLEDALGRPDAAMDALERAHRRHEPLTYGLSLEGWLPFTNSRPTPRFEALLRAIGARPHDLPGQRALLSTIPD